MDYEIVIVRCEFNFATGRADNSPWLYPPEESMCDPPGVGEKFTIHHSKFTIFYSTNLRLLRSRKRTSQFKIHHSLFYQFATPPESEEKFTIQNSPFFILPICNSSGVGEKFTIFCSTNLWLRWSRRKIHNFLFCQFVTPWSRRKIHNSPFKIHNFLFYQFATPVEAEKNSPFTIICTDVRLLRNLLNEFNIFHKAEIIMTLLLIWI
jgi:hypothetical protein